MTDLVLVVDFGAQYAQLIARRVREAHVYSEIVLALHAVAEMLAREPKAIILSGGPASVHVDGAPSIDPAIYDAGVPILGICYGAQLIASRSRRRGRARPAPASTAARRCDVDGTSPLFADQPAEQVVWMSHGDSIDARAARVRRHRDAPRARRSPALEDRDRGDLRRAVPPRGGAHRARPGGAEGVPLRRRRLPADVDERVDHRARGRRDPRPGRHRARDLRAVGRRRLRGRGGPRAQGDRRPAHVRVRRHRAAAPRRGRAGGEHVPRGSSRSTSCT